MKKKNLQKVLATALVGAMAVGPLTGCGGDEGGKDGDINVSGEAGIAGYEAFAEQVTLSIPVYDRGKEGVPAIGTGENYWEGWVQKEFADKYNIKMEWIPITRSDVMTSYNLLAASDDLPTIMMEYDYPKHAEWASNGYLQEYNLDVFAHVAPTYYQQMVDLGQIKYTEMNGKCYFVTANRPYFNTNYTWANFVRMDWLKKVGYDHVPTTRAEYLDAMKKIQDAGIAAHPGGGSMTTDGVGIDQNYSFRQYPTDEAEWAMYGDYNIVSLSWEPNKKFLKRQNENYNLGITDPEYYTIDAATAEANFINGKTYSYGAYIAADMPVLKSFYETNPGAELALDITSTVADTEGGTVPAQRSNNPFGMMIGFSSDATADEIKAAMMYMEWAVQPENLFTYQWGFEGEHYTLDEKGLPVSVGDYSGDKTQGYNNNKDYWCVAIEARNAGTIEDMIAAASPKGLPHDFTQDLIKQYYNQVANWEKGWVPTDCMFSVAIESVAEYSGALATKYAEYRDKLVTCKPEEFDKLYEEYSKAYLEAGYQAIIDERKAAYEAGNSSKSK